MLGVTIVIWESTSHISWRRRGLRKSVIIRVTIWVFPFRVLSTLLITYLLSPLGLKVMIPEALWEGIPS